MKQLSLIAVALLGLSELASASDKQLSNEVAADYQAHLKPLFMHLHQNPELSLAEHKTAERLAEELASLDYTVHSGIGGTGVVALMENGPGPLVMFRADMDGLPIREQSGLDYASQAYQVDPVTEEERPVMHACGHDMHMTTLVGAARYMASHKDEWSGTLMFVGQPAEERLMGAKKMMLDDLWQRFGTPDYAFGLHVDASAPAGSLYAEPGAVMAGSNSVDIIIHGVGTHGAYPHAGKDPVVVGSKIVMALQTLVSRELAPREAGVVTVGAFQAGSKHNIIPDRAHLKLTVRSDNPQTREKLLSGIRRIAVNEARASGIPEDLLPEVTVSDVEVTQPVTNDVQLSHNLNAAWRQQFGAEAVQLSPNVGMGSEDYSEFITDPAIPSVYWRVGGTPPKDLDLARQGLIAMPTHHSPFFKIDPDTSVPVGVASTVLAIKSVMPHQ